MYQSLLLPEADVAALRAAVALPQFQSLAHSVPGLSTALSHPQPDFGPYLHLVDDAVGEVRSNTNYPEDWDPLSEAVDEASKARRSFHASAKEGRARGRAVSLKAFILVSERMGSNDGPSFGKHVHFDFPSAKLALQAWAKAEFDPEMDPELALEEYGSTEAQTAGFNVVTRHESVVTQYYLKAFEVAPVLTAGEVAA